MNFSIVIPCYNESQVVGETVRVLADSLNKVHPGDHEIIIVDDGSTDGSYARCKEIKGIKVIAHKVNRGYGASIKTGIRAAIGRFVATYDGDGQHRPEDLLALFDRIKSEGNDLVIGTRTKLIHSNLWKMPGKWLLNHLARYLTKASIPDLNSGLRVFKRDVIHKYLHLCPDRFSFSTTSTLVFISRNYSIDYIPISVRQRVGKGTVGIKDGFDTMLLILRTVALFEPLRIFIPASIVLITVGMLWGVPYLIMGRGLSIGSLLLILSGLLIFFFGIIADQISSLRKEKFE